jgi:hypothetical protein
MSGLTYWPQPAPVEQTGARRRPACPPPSVAGPRKALYLDGRTQAIDVRALGPALGITRGAQQFSLPLARLARVIVCGRVHWDSAALALCLQQGLPVIFLDARAQPLGAAAPLRGRSSTLDELLAEWVERPRWREGFDNWLRAQRFRVLRHWAQGRARQGRPLDAGTWKEAVRSFVYLAEPDFTGPNAGGCYALVVAVLVRAGVRLQYRAIDGGVLALADDIARIAGRYLALDLGSLAPALGEHEALTARATESSAPDLEDFVVELLARLRRNLADRIEPWP